MLHVGCTPHLHNRFRSLKAQLSACLPSQRDHVPKLSTGVRFSSPAPFPLVRGLRGYRSFSAGEADVRPLTDVTVGVVLVTALRESRLGEPIVGLPRGCCTEVARPTPPIERGAVGQALAALVPQRPISDRRRRSANRYTPLVSVLPWTLVATSVGQVAGADRNLHTYASGGSLGTRVHRRDVTLRRVHAASSGAALSSR